MDISWATEVKPLTLKLPVDYRTVIFFDCCGFSWWIECGRIKDCLVLLGEINKLDKLSLMKVSTPLALILVSQSLSPSPSISEIAGVHGNDASTWRWRSLRYSNPVSCRWTTQNFTKCVKLREQWRMLSLLRRLCGSIQHCSITRCSFLSVVMLKILMVRDSITYLSTLNQSASSPYRRECGQVAVASCNKLAWRTPFD